MNKTGKEIKLDLYKNYKIFYGSISNKDPKSIYISISSWGLPTSMESINYDKQIRKLNKDVKQIIFNKLLFEHSDFIKERTIIDLDMRESGIRFGKKSYINCEITLFLKRPISVTSEHTKNKISEIIKIVIDNVFEKNNSFKFYKEKKQYI